MKRRYKKKSAELLRIAKERIAILFGQADKVFDEDKALSDRYVQLARKISMKYKVRLDSSQKKRFCKNCGAFLKPPVNCRVRVYRGKIIYCCLDCKHYMRLLYSPKGKGNEAAGRSPLKSGQLPGENKTASSRKKKISRSIDGDS